MTQLSKNYVFLIFNPNNSKQYYFSKILKNKVQASSAGNAESCYLDVDIFAEVCSVVPDQFNCGGSSGASSPTDVVNLPNLAAGDKFTTADYTVTVTTATGSQATGWSGTGSLDFNFLKLPGGSRAVSIPIAVSFTNIKINECYQLAAGVVLTQYDADWTNVADATVMEDQLKDLYAEMSEILMADDALNKAALQSKVDLLSEVRNQINTADFTTEYKTAQLTAIDGIIADCNTLIASTTSTVKTNESFAKAEAVTRASVNNKMVGACDAGAGINSYFGDVFDLDDISTGRNKLESKPGKDIIIKSTNFGVYPSYKLLSSIMITASNSFILTKIAKYYADQLGINYSGFKNSNFGIVNVTFPGGGTYRARDIFNSDGKGSISIEGVAMMYTEPNRTITIQLTNNLCDNLLNEIGNFKSMLYHEWMHYSKQLNQDDAQHCEVYYLQSQHSTFKDISSGYKDNIKENIRKYLDRLKGINTVEYNSYLSKFKSIGLYGK